MSKPKLHPNGTWTLMVSLNRKRTNLTLGKFKKDYVEDFARRVSELVEFTKHGGKSIPLQLQAWLDDLNDRHAEQLSSIGLFEYKSATSTIGSLMDAYVASYELGTNRPSTKLKIASTVKNRFGRLKAYQIRELEPRRVSVRVNADPVWTEDAKKILTQFNSWQRNHFATATWSRDNKLLSSIGIWAVKNGYCDYNPFSILPSKSMVNDERNQYVETDSVLSAMDSCLDPDTRITIALGRFGGFRTPSESATLKWSMVNFDRGTIDVMDSKKQKLRRMPMFERLREELQRRRTDSGRKSGFVVSDRDRASSNANNFNLIREAVERSGQDPWPRLRQNLRASCENDLLKLFDERKVTAWLGHTISVSRNHYQKQRDIDYREAADEWSKFQQSN